MFVPRWLYREIEKKASEEIGCGEMGWFYDVNLSANRLCKAGWTPCGMELGMIRMPGRSARQVSTDFLATHPAH